MSEHTPGPWEVTSTLQNDGVYEINDPFRHIPNAEIKLDLDDRYEVMEANARLIAAVPDLLKACKVALNAINLNDETVTARKALDAAIEKAEGKPTLWAKEMT